MSSYLTCSGATNSQKDAGSVVTSKWTPECWGLPDASKGQVLFYWKVPWHGTWSLLYFRTACLPSAPKGWQSAKPQQISGHHNGTYSTDPQVAAMREQLPPSSSGEQSWTNPRRHLPPDPPENWEHQWWVLAPQGLAKILVPSRLTRPPGDPPFEHLGPPTKVIATNVKRRDFGELTRGHEDKVIASISAQPGTMHGGEEKKRKL